MTKGLYHQLRQKFKKPEREAKKARLIEWRKGPRFSKVKKPLNLARARALGYKAKKGIVVIRIRLKRGNHKKTRPNMGRRSKRLTIRKNLKMSYRWIAEQRVANKYKNLEVINSYQIGKDGIYYFFEVICVDPNRPEIQKDKNLNWTTKTSNKKRAHKGVTSAGKKSRGLRDKNPKNKSRPSVRAGKRRGK